MRGHGLFEGYYKDEEKTRKAGFAAGKPKPATDPFAPFSVNRTALEAASAATLAAAPVLPPMQFPVAQCFPPSLSDMSLGSWVRVECKEEPADEPATPVPKTDNKAGTRPPPVPKGSAARELEAQAIEARSSPAARQSNIAKQQAIERRASVPPPPKQNGAIRPINPNTYRPASLQAKSHEDSIARRYDARTKAASATSEASSGSAPQQSYTGQWNSNWQWSTEEWNTWNASTPREYDPTPDWDQS